MSEGKSIDMTLEALKELAKMEKKRLKSQLACLDGHYLKYIEYLVAQKQSIKSNLIHVHENRMKLIEQETEQLGSSMANDSNISIIDLNVNDTFDSDATESECESGKDNTSMKQENSNSKQSKSCSVSLSNTNDINVMEISDVRNKLQRPKSKQRIRFQCQYCKQCFRNAEIIKSHIAVMHEFDKCNITQSDTETSNRKKSEIIDLSAENCDPTPPKPIKNNSEMQTLTKQKNHNIDSRALISVEPKQRVSKTASKSKNNENEKNSKGSQTKTRKKRRKKFLFQTPKRDLFCKECNKSFATAQGYQFHQNIHLKKFGCDICGAYLSCKYNLVQHRRIHTGEKPFECDICHRKFSRKFDLNTHMKKTHK